MDFDAAVAAFQQKLAEFQSVWALLVSKASVAASNSSLKAEYDDLMGEGSLLQSTIDSVTGAIDYVRNAAAQVESIFGGMGGLGIAPLILLGIIATITGGTAFIAKWLTDAYALAKKLQAQEALLAAGADPNVVASSFSDQTFFGNLGSTVGSGLLWIGVGLAVLWFAKSRGKL